MERGPLTYRSVSLAFSDVDLRSQGILAPRSFGYQCLRFSIAWSEIGARGRSAPVPLLYTSEAAFGRLGREFGKTSDFERGVTGLTPLHLYLG